MTKRFDYNSCNKEVRLSRCWDILMWSWVFKSFGFIKFLNIRYHTIRRGNITRGHTAGGCASGRADRCRVRPPLLLVFGGRDSGGSPKQRLLVDLRSGAAVRRIRCVHRFAFAKCMFFFFFNVTFNRTETFRAVV